MIYGYMRQIPNLENLVKQKQKILTFAHQKGLLIEKEVVEYATKNLVIDKRKDFEQFLKSLGEGDYTVIVSSLDILSTRVDELVKIIGCVLSHEVDLWIVESNVLINKQSTLLEVIPLLEAQRSQPNEIPTPIGRPKGSKSESKFDIYHNQIIELLSAKKNVSMIARELEVSRSSLKDYIHSRGLKELVSTITLSTDRLMQKEMDNIVLICPFEKEAQHKILTRIS